MDSGKGETNRIEDVVSDVKVAGGEDPKLKALASFSRPPVVSDPKLKALASFNGQTGGLDPKLKALGSFSRPPVVSDPKLKALVSFNGKAGGSDPKLKALGSFSRPPVVLDPKLKAMGSFKGQDGFIRADKIDLKSLDVKLEKKLSKVWMKTNSFLLDRPKEVWEIDLSKLHIRYVVAKGTYGTVYRGTYDGGDVAVKLLDWGEDGYSTDAETASLRASFRQEVAVWHQVDHPNVTKFIGASMGTSDLKIPQENPTTSNVPAWACCVVVEFLAGGTLKQYLIKNWRKKLQFKIVVQLALDLARGLSYLHSKKVVHRDVKTENMLLNNHRVLKIADFGVARVEAQNPKDMTGETGTLGYMAPEVFQGKPYNRSCDVYSFGICLWEIYCCDMPYANLSFAEVSSAVVRQNLRPDIPRCCPNSLANIMRKCWDANPDKRPLMDEVVKLLEAIDTSKGGGMIPEDQVGGCFCFPSHGP